MSKLAFVAAVVLFAVLAIVQRHAASWGWFLPAGLALLAFGHVADIFHLLR